MPKIITIQNTSRSIHENNNQKSFVIFSLLALLIFGVSMNSFAASAAEHDALASQFENLAKEMQAKAKKKKEKEKEKRNN